MDYSELKRFALDANTQRTAMYMGLDDVWITAEELLQDGVQKEITACFIAAASPDVVLGLLAEVERLQSNIDERTGGVVRLMTERDTLRTQNQAQLELNAALLMDCGVLTNKNQALLEALKEGEQTIRWIDHPRVNKVWDKARAAIKLAEEKDV